MVLNEKKGRATVIKKGYFFALHQKLSGLYRFHNYFYLLVFRKDLRRLAGFV